VIAITGIGLNAITLILAGPRARTNGPAFAAGWLIMFLVIGTFGLGISFGVDVMDLVDIDSPNTGIDLLLIALGVLVWVMAVRQWRGRSGHDVDTEPPAWLSTVDDFTMPRAFTMAALLTLRPKTFVLLVAGSGVIAGSGEVWAVRIGMQGVFVALSSAAVLVPVIAFQVRGARVVPVLVRVRLFLVRHMSTVMVVMLLLVGLVLVENGIEGLLD
jgi:hypothetical protein